MDLFSSTRTTDDGDRIYNTYFDVNLLHYDPYDMGSHSDDLGAASTLSRYCLSCMHDICKANRGTSNTNEGWSKLREEMDGFFLWSESFEAEELDLAISMLDDLRLSVFECLTSIGDGLIHGQ